MKHMKHMKLFEEFHTDLTLCLINEEITLNEYLNSIENSLNEELLGDIFQFFKNFKTKVLDGMIVFLKQSAKVGLKIFNSVFSLFKLAVDQISKFKEKNPVLYKAIVITLLVIVLMILSTGSAYAKATGQPIDPNQIDMVIGYIKSSTFDAGNREETWKLLNDMLSYLSDLRDGKIDASHTQRTIDFANDAIKTVSGLQEKTDDRSISICKKMLEIGKEWILQPHYYPGK